MKPLSFLKGPNFSYFICAQLLLVPAIIYYLTIRVYLINVPFCDEYNAALQWLIDFQKLNSFGDKFLHLFAQTNEHRLFSYHLAVLTDHSLFGMLHFKRMLWVGNAGMIVLCFLLFKLHKDNGNRPWTFLPVILLVFVPQHEISDWGIVVYGSVIQMLLAIASMMFLNVPGRMNLAVSIILAIMATFSFGNGMFVFISGYLILYLRQKKNQKDWIIWTSAMVIAISLFFIDYKSSLVGDYHIGLLKHLAESLEYFFIFFGAIFYPFQNVNSLFFMFAGIVSIFAFCSILYFKWNHLSKQPIPLAICSFIILSAMAAAVSRINYGVFAAKGDRYLLMQGIFLCILYMFSISIFKSAGRWVLPVVIFASIGLYSSRIKNNIISMQYHNYHLSHIIFNYHVDYKAIRTYFLQPDEIKRIIDNSKHDHVYYPPTIKQLYPEIRLMNVPLPKTSSDKITCNVEVLCDYPDAMRVSGWACLKNKNQYNQEIGIVLRADTNTVIFSTRRTIIRDAARHLEYIFPWIINHKGFTFMMEKSSFAVQHGKYQMGLCILQNGKVVDFQFTDKYVIF